MSTGLAHTHTVASHSHSVNSHSHGINADGAHHHYYGDDNGRLTPPVAPTIPIQQSQANRGNNNYQTAAPGVPEAFAYKDHSHYGWTDDQGSHAHGGVTGTATPSTSSAAPATDSQLGTLDKRPSFVGLLYIIKVKN
jgi:hypothetical protein